MAMSLANAAGAAGSERYCCSCRVAPPEPTPCYQALLGSMLFKGEEVSRQAALGLFWLIVAKDAAKPDETWITDMYTSALAQANETERAVAHKYLEDWLKNRRE